MDHLPAYLAIERWAPGRVVVVVAPRGPEGPLRLREVGARVIVVGELEPLAGLDVRPGVPTLPLPDGSAQLVVCFEGWAALESSQRARLVGEARRVLSAEGLFAAWSRQPRNPGDQGVDFWTLESELAVGFERVQMFAQLPWRGFSVAPVTDDDRAPPVVVREALLREPPEATHYLALGGSRMAESRLADAVQCVLVPLGADESASVSLLPVAATTSQLEVERELATVQLALARSDELARTRETDVAVLTRSLREVEQASVRNGERADLRAKELDERNQVVTELRARLDGAAAERDHLARQLEIAAVEREAARQLAVRFEAEIDFARRRAGTTEEQLAEKIIESSRLGAEASMLRERVDQQERTLAAARSRTDELSATAAQSAEQGRMHAEIGFDRDRLREELGRRTAALEKLEERLWNTRDDAQRDRIDLVKTNGELERLRDQLERTRQVEQERGHEIERLGAELRRTELERADAMAAVRMREEDTTRLRREVDAMASRSGDLQRLRDELEARGAELAELGARLERVTAQERSAQALAKRREQQLVEVGVELERLGAEVARYSQQGTGLQGELDVRLVELEQLAASVGDLQQQVETTRFERREAEARATELQHQLEQLAAEREMLRRHLREREQELDDVASAQESSGAELFLLRRELEASAEANERKSGALQHPGSLDDEQPMHDWPQQAIVEVLRLRAELELAATTRAPGERSGSDPSGPRADDSSPDRARLRRLQLEVEIRAQEHEQVLGQLDGAEQRIWEMSDASDRNAARLAAGLAQLEKQREQFDDTLEELQVTRNLLAASQARALEQGRLLASERAKLARLGMGDTTPRLVDADNIDDLFAELDEVDRTEVIVQPIPVGRAVALAEVATEPDRADSKPESARGGPAAPRGDAERLPSEPSGIPTPHFDRGPAVGSRPIDLVPPSGPRVVVESLPDDAWREPD